MTKRYPWWEVKWDSLYNATGRWYSNVETYETRAACRRSMRSERTRNFAVHNITIRPLDYADKGD